jgi:hypothetical protein
LFGSVSKERSSLQGNEQSNDDEDEEELFERDVSRGAVTDLREAVYSMEGLQGQEDSGPCVDIPSTVEISSEIELVERALSFYSDIKRQIADLERELELETKEHERMLEERLMLI